MYPRVEFVWKEILLLEETIEFFPSEKKSYFMRIITRWTSFRSETTIL